MKISNLLLSIFGGSDPGCPNDATVLAYSEHKLSAPRRVQCERHFAGCDDCRELLAFLGRESAEAAAPLTRKDITEQTNRVLAYIRNDELNRPMSVPRARAARGFHVSYPRLATVSLVFCALLVAAVFLLTRGQSPADAAMEALTLGLKDQRRTEARISGGFGYSRYNGVTRGADANQDNLAFDLALAKLRSAENENAPVKDRLTLARAYLARGTRSDVDHGLRILTTLAERGYGTADVLNDIGVAHLQLGDYDKAIEYFTGALATRSDYDEALFNRALAEQRDRRDDDARRDWQQFIDRPLDDNWKTEARKNLSSLATSNR